MTIAAPPEAKPKRVKEQKGKLVPSVELTAGERLAGLRFYGDLEEVRYSGFWFRVWARFVDGIVYGLVNTGIAVLFVYLVYLSHNTDDCHTRHLPGKRTYEICYADHFVMWLLGGICLTLALIVIWFGLIRPVGKTGQTIGRKARRIRVMDKRTHCPIGVRESFWRFSSPILISALPWFVRDALPWLVRRVLVSGDDLAYFDHMFHSWATVLFFVCAAITVIGTLWMLIDANHQTWWDKLARAIVVQDPPAPYR